MRLEVNEESITENVSEEDLKKLSFDQTVCVLTGPEHYLQLWIDEDGGDNEFYYCPEGGDPVTCVAPENPDPTQCLQFFTSFLKGDQTWAKDFDWTEPTADDAEQELLEDLWEAYPCEFEDGATGVVCYDHGISEVMEQVEIQQFVGIKVALKKPDEDGLASDEEDEILEKLEDGLDNAINDRDGIFVGRITRQGERKFYCYLDATAVEVDEMLGALKQQSGYEMEFVLEPDPEKSHYWEELYPPAEGLILIMDSKLVQLHLEQGDHLEASRLVEFWVDLPSEQTLTSFEVWAKKEELQVSRQAAPKADGDPFSVVVSKEMPIELPNVYAISSQIFAKAHELEGDYVGWECGIIDAV